MRNKIAFAAMATLILAQAAAAKTSSHDDRVAACTHEAQTGYETARRLEPSLRPTIEGHRARMIAICRLGSTEEAAMPALLAQCLHEAARGPRHIQRGRNSDRDHVRRQQDACHRLAGPA